MCESGIIVLDVYFISDLYLFGIKDGIYYNEEVFNFVIEFLERYFFL